MQSGEGLGFVNGLRIAVMAVVLLLVSLVLIPLQLVALRFDWRLRRRLPRHWHRIALYCLGIRVHAHGRLDRRRPLMIAANHASWKDILVLGSLADVVFIAKTRSPPGRSSARSPACRRPSSSCVRKSAAPATRSMKSPPAWPMERSSCSFPKAPRRTAIASCRSNPRSSARRRRPAKGCGKRRRPCPARCHRLYPHPGLPMGRYHRPIAGWPGDIGLVPHLLGVLRAARARCRRHLRRDRGLPPGRQPQEPRQPCREPPAQSAARHLRGRHGR